MSLIVQSDVRNRILATLSADDFSLLAPRLQPVALPRGFVLAEEGRQIERVFFPESGIGAVAATTPDGRTVETGIFGRDGLSPVGAVLGVDRVHKREFMQIPGEGHAIERSAFEAALEESASLRSVLSAYAYTMLIQTNYTALSNAVHSIDERLARWLLMCDDRTDGLELAVTHEFISVVLAVRRPSVTTALHVLEGAGFVRSERGVVMIRNRKALEAFAGDSYGVAEAEYRRLIGPMR